MGSHPPHPTDNLGREDTVGRVRSGERGMWSLRSKGGSREGCVYFYNYYLGVASPECENKILKNLTSGNSCDSLRPCPLDLPHGVICGDPLVVTHSTPPSQ